MNVNDVIKYPILTEKTYQQMHEYNIYSFAVDKRTNKVEVRKAVEFIFNVKVLKVNILTIDAKPKRMGRFLGYTNSYKKALVYLANGNKISFFPEEEKNEDSKIKKDSKPVENEAKELSEAEKKAAAKIAKASETKKSSNFKVDKDIKSKVSTTKIVKKPVSKKQAK